mmetsp:Transcript_75913/g.180431  ORF Transcript_75913/g.180431 Transcript_75913/m.180431 type:complete len:292 (+) Transcript_75913:2060-2935(+)
MSNTETSPPPHPPTRHLTAPFAVESRPDKSHSSDIFFEGTTTVLPFKLSSTFCLDLHRSSVLCTAVFRRNLPVASCGDTAVLLSLSPLPPRKKDNAWRKLMVATAPSNSTADSTLPPPVEAEATASLLSLLLQIGSEIVATTQTCKLDAVRGAETTTLDRELGTRSSESPTSKTSFSRSPSAPIAWEWTLYCTTLESLHTPLHESSKASWRPFSTRSWLQQGSRSVPLPKVAPSMSTQAEEARSAASPCSSVDSRATSSGSRNSHRPAGYPFTKSPFSRCPRLLATVEGEA